MQNRAIQAENILKILPARRINIFWYNFKDWKEPGSSFELFWKTESKPLILTYPPRGIGEIFHTVLFLSVNLNIGLPKPMEKSVTSALKILAKR